jgi:hypothetical protein
MPGSDSIRTEPALGHKSGFAVNGLDSARERRLELSLLRSLMV